MDCTVDDEHRSRLRGEVRLRLLGEKLSGLENAGFAVADIEDAVRLFVEVRYLAGSAGARRGIAIILSVRQLIPAVNLGGRGCSLHRRERLYDRVFVHGSRRDQPCISGLQI
jgi:hypothetical protein